MSILMVFSFLSDAAFCKFRDSKPEAYQKLKIFWEQLIAVGIKPFLFIPGNTATTQLRLSLETNSKITLHHWSNPEGSLPKALIEYMLKAGIKPADYPKENIFFIKHDNEISTFTIHQTIEKTFQMIDLNLADPEHWNKLKSFYTNSPQRKIYFESISMFPEIESSPEQQKFAEENGFVWCNTIYDLKHRTRITPSEPGIGEKCLYTTMSFDELQKKIALGCKATEKIELRKLGDEIGFVPFAKTLIRKEEVFFLYAGCVVTQPRHDIFSGNYTVNAPVPTGVQKKDELLFFKRINAEFYRNIAGMVAHLPNSKMLQHYDLKKINPKSVQTENLKFNAIWIPDLPPKKKGEPSGGVVPVLEAFKDIPEGSPLGFNYTEISEYFRIHNYPRGPRLFWRDRHTLIDLKDYDYCPTTEVPYKFILDDCSGKEVNIITFAENLFGEEYSQSSLVAIQVGDPSSENTFSFSMPSRILLKAKQNALAQANKNNQSLDEYCRTHTIIIQDPGITFGRNNTDQFNIHTESLSYYFFHPLSTVLSNSLEIAWDCAYNDKRELVAYRGKLFDKKLFDKNTTKRDRILRSDLIETFGWKKISDREYELVFYLEKIEVFNIDYIANYKSEVLQQKIFLDQWNSKSVTPQNTSSSKEESSKEEVQEKPSAAELLAKSLETILRLTSQTRVPAAESMPAKKKEFKYG